MSIQIWIEFFNRFTSVSIQIELNFSMGLTVCLYRLTWIFQGVRQCVYTDLNLIFLIGSTVCLYRFEFDFSIGSTVCLYRLNWIFQWVRQCHECVYTDWLEFFNGFDSVSIQIYIWIWHCIYTYLNLFFNKSDSVSIHIWIWFFNWFDSVYTDLNWIFK